MRSLRVFAIVVAVLTGSVTLPGNGWAQGGAPAEGEVVKVDLHAGMITIRHGPIRSLGLGDASATHDFKPAEPMLFNALRPGDHLRFTADRVNGQLTIVAVQPY